MKREGMSLGQAKRNRSLYKKRYIIILLLTIIGVIWICAPRPDALDRYFDNKEIIHQLSDEIFEGIESQTIQVGEVLGIDHNYERMKALGLTKKFNKVERKNSIEAIRIRSSSLIWLVEYGRGHVISGIAITKDNIMPEREDDLSMFDTGTLHYKKIDDNTYFFSAGL